jgi:deoxyribonuclease V
MQVAELHRWDMRPAEAVEIQRELRGRLRMYDGVELSAIRTVAGADNGYLRRESSTIAFAAVVVFSYPDLELLETQTASCPVEFPYVPGLLSFREGPALLSAFRKVEHEPDVILFDAQGYAHPRRFGAASHFGLILDRPSIGCAKSRLTGRYEEPGPEVGARSPLVDRGEVIGTVLRTRPSRSPLFVSVGHRISLPSAVELALACSRGKSIMPEPTRLADKLVRELSASWRLESGSDRQPPRGSTHR